jgi:predicted nucleic acid-binding protein
MILTKVLIDTNICLDSALQRTPFDIPAAKILSLSEQKNIIGFVAAHTFDTIFYLLKNKYSTDQSYESIETIRETVQIAPVTETIIDNAMALKWKDFEDAIHYQAAVAAGCQAIITRNGKDFKKAEIPVLTPQEFLDQFEGDKGE